MNFLEQLVIRKIEHRTHGQHHHTRAGWVQMDCPKCSPASQRWRLGWNLAKGYFVCWKCGPKRSRETLAEVFGIPWNDAKGILGALPRLAAEPGFKRTGLVLPEPREPLMEAHIDYLTGRGFDVPRLVEQYRIEGIGRLGGAYSWRVFIPIFYRGVMVSFTTRTIGTAGLRYRAASPEEEAMNHKHLLFGGDYVTSAVLIHEGPLDAMAMGPGAVGLCGTGFTPPQVRRLAEIPIRTICFDSEPAAQERARALADTLSVFPGKTQIIELDAEDAAESTPEERVKVRRAACLD